MSQPAQPARRRDRLRRLIVDVEPLRRDRDFRYLWMGQVVSGLGRQVTSIVLPYQLYVLTGTPLAIGALALVQVVPIMAFSLGGGVVADAVDRRRLLLLTQAGLAAASAALAGLAMMSAPPVLAIYAVAFVAAGLGAMDQPARSSAVPRLVPRERLPAALALGQLNFQAAGVVGPAIGGLVIATLGIAAGYAFDAITFGAAIGALLLIAPIPPAHGAVRPSLAAIAEGLRFARRRRAILGTFAVDLNAMVFGMPTALFPVLALDVFRVGPAGLGLLAAAPAAGALVGAVLTGWVGRVRRTGRAVLWASAGWGVAITAFGLCTFSFPLALVFLAAAGAADVVTAVLRSAIVQLLTPDELRGRVTSIHILVVTGGPRLGDVEASGGFARGRPALGHQRWVALPGRPRRHRPLVPGAGRVRHVGSGGARTVRAGAGARTRSLTRPRAGDQRRAGPRRPCRSPVPRGGGVYRWRMAIGTLARSRATRILGIG